MASAILDFNNERKGVRMPMEIRRPSTRIIEQIRAPDVTSLSLTPLAIIAVLAFVLHLAGGMMLERSQASGMIGAGSVVVDDEVGCA